MAVGGDSKAMETMQKHMKNKVNLYSCKRSGWLKVELPHGTELIHQYNAAPKVFFHMFLSMIRCQGITVLSVSMDKGFPNIALTHLKRFASWSGQGFPKCGPHSFQMVYKSEWTEEYCGILAAR